jgi:acetyltransferase
MSIRNVEALFSPAAIALIGASNEAGSMGQVVARNLVEGGFCGPIMMVNPHEASICGRLAYHSIAELPATPDLAVIATPAATIPGILDRLGARGCRAAVIISAGFEGKDAAPLRQGLLNAARPHLMRLIGPNCLGLMSTPAGINASFAHLMPRAGGLALVAQSGAVAAATLDWAAGAGVGFSHVVTIGDGLDVDVGDLVDYLAVDPTTTAILLYIEGLTDGPKFMRAARAASRIKPVVAIKAGRSVAGAKAAFSHTGALAGADVVYDAALRQAGVVRVDDLRSFFGAAATLSAGVQLGGAGLAILTNGGGAGVLATDALARGGGQLAQLSAATVEALAQVAPAHWSGGNPVDILGDACADDYAATLKVLLAAPEVDSVLAMNCPTAVADGAAAAQAVAAVVAQSATDKPVLACWLGEVAATRSRAALAAGGQPAFETPEEAVAAFLRMVQWGREATAPAVAAHTPDPQGAVIGRRVIAAAQAAGRTVLTDPETRELLAAYGVPVVLSHTAKTPKDAGLLADRIGRAVALKVLSPDLSHKSDVGGVVLGLTGAAQTEAAALAMLARLAEARPKATIEGFVVEPMIERRHGHELLIGIARDPVFGPVILFGQGGVATEVLADRSLALPPIDASVARGMIGSTRVSRLLAGFRDRPAVAMDAVESVVVTLGQMALDLPQIAELDINPLIADESGVLAIDARVGLQPDRS